MKTGLKAKFLQFPEAKHLLLSTGHKILTHHCNDLYWGDGLDGDGQNMLGNFLMDIRKELQDKDSDVRYICCLFVCLFGCLFVCLFGCLDRSYKPLQPHNKQILQKAH